MKLILSREEAFNLDRESNSKGYISNHDLMKNAGRLSAEYFIDTIDNPFNKKVLVIAGSGNNGADAFIMHYYLIKYGINSKIYFINRSKLKYLFRAYDLSDNCEVHAINSNVVESFDWFIDGIFGIGLNRPVKGRFKEIIELLSNKSIFSLDIPSGLDCDTGMSFNSNLLCKPSHVVSMGYLKPGNIINEGKQYFRHTEILDIEFPKAENLIDIKNRFLIEKEDVISIVEKDNILRHKYDSFCSLVVGSKKYCGAGVLAMLATLKAGGTYVQTLVPKNISDIYRNANPESRIVEIGKRDYFYSNNFKKVVDNISYKKAPVLIGPGLGRDKSTQSSVIKILKYLKAEKYNCVLDASGFQPLYSNQITIDDLPEDCILTPHRGEFDKIFPQYCGSNRSQIDICEEVSNKLNGRVLILKGPTTIIVSRDKNIYILNNSNSLLSCAGSGDVLAGILTGLLAYGYDIDKASIIGVYVHSLCSDIFYSEKSKYKMCSKDILDIIPRAFNEVVL